MQALPEKGAARAAVKALLKAATREDLAEQSKSICRKILDLAVYKKAATIAGYLTSVKLREVDTELLVADAFNRRLKIYVPVVIDPASNMQMLHLDSLSCLKEVPPFGIREPVPYYDDGTPRQTLLQPDCKDMPDVILMPGLGFDRTGRRLGRGGGYYDKFIAQLLDHAKHHKLPKPSLVGLCFRQQVLDVIPMDNHDQAIDWLVTPDEVVDCRLNAD